MYLQPTSGEFKDIAQAISAVLSTIAVIVAGLWAYWKFIWQKEKEPRAEFDVNAEFIGKQNGKWLLEVSAQLVNRGKVRHLMEDASINIRYLTASDEVAESANAELFRQISFPHSIGRRAIWRNSFIDPGLSFRISYVSWVPQEATYVLLLCKFKYEPKQEWPAQRLLKVPTSQN